MPVRGTFLRYWLPVLLWMSFIFMASTDLLSSQRTSRFIGPFLRRLVPDISDQAVDRIQYGLRKTGHVAEYAVLACLLWRLRRRPPRADPRRWCWADAAWALAGAGLYALTDEWHQRLVASRYASVGDVLLDTAGAAAGLAMCWLAGHWRGRW
jgi:VanZ family protein